MRILIVLAKSPGSGAAKTRLVAADGSNAAFVARLADAFLRDTVRVCRRSAIDELWLAFAPADAEAYFRSLDAGARLVPQARGGLGERLRAVFAAAFAGGATRAVAIGADTPHISASTIADAFARLEAAPVVIGPARDGGYYLIGLRQRADLLFEQVAWSTPLVRSQTEARASELGLAVGRLPESFDVDEPEDLARLRELCARDPGLAPRTAELLRER